MLSIATYIKNFVKGVIDRTKEVLVAVYNCVTKKEPLTKGIKDGAQTIANFVKDIIIFKILSKMPKWFLAVVALIVAATFIGEKIIDSKEMKNSKNVTTVHTIVEPV